MKAGDVNTSGYAIDRKSWMVVEESILTGESGASQEKTEHVITENSIIGDQKRTWSSLVHLFKSGSAIGVVVATGDETEIGKINPSFCSQ